jgi:cell pole-organizing protein PopZ
MSDGKGNSNKPGPAGAAEPSMEEILASIRRILTEEENERAARPPEPGDDDVLVLDSGMVAPGAEMLSPTQLPPAPPMLAETQASPPSHLASAASLQAPTHGAGLATYIPASALPPGPATPYTPQPPQKEDEMSDNFQVPAGLVSDKAANEIANTVGSLVRSVSSDRTVTVGRPGVTIEDLVREEIKPVLKSWLDTHLPNLVERVVRAEIGRVIDRMQS